MKLQIKLLLIVIVFLALVLIGLHIFVNIKGRSILTKKLEETLNRKIIIGSLTTSFPTNIHVRNIEAKGLFKIDEVFAGGGLFDIFRNSFNLSLLKIVKPVVTIEKNFIKSTTEALMPSDINLQEKTDNQDKAMPPNLNPLALSQNRFLPWRFSIRHLIVSDGVFNFIDRSIGKDGLSIKTENVNIKVDNLNFSIKSSQITSFELKAKVPWQEGKEVGKIEAEGWLNLFKKDIQATLKIKDIDGIALYPYYSQWVDLEKARIQSAKLNFTSDIHGLNNNVTANCRLELTDIVRRPVQEGETEEKAAKITDAVLDIFKALNEGKIILDFTIRTKMDMPEFGFGNIKTAVEEKLSQGHRGNGLKAEDFLNLPVKIIEGTIKSATDISRAVIESTIALGKAVVVDPFKKEKKE